MVSERIVEGSTAAGDFPDDEIHVWQAELSAQPEDWQAIGLETLSAEEHARRGRLLRAHDALMFGLARWMLRSILGWTMGVEPRLVCFEQGPFGKPRLAAAHGSPLCFNVTHSGSLVMIALTRGREVGIDVEALRPIQNLEALVRNTFSATEQAAILSAPDREAHFFAAWTRKEAIIKAVGRGLHLPLADFDVDVDPTARPALRASRDASLKVADWIMHQLPPVTGYASALAVERRMPSNVRWKAWPLADQRGG